MSVPRLDPARLGQVLAERTRHALDCGALQPIETTQEIVEDAGVAFIVRRVSSLARKEAARRRRAGNPFLPPEPDLLVGAVSPTHLAVLNKFSVIERHLLLVTKDFAPQEAALDRNDFSALASCLRGIDALGFFNGGTGAGASQAHRHLQLVPLPLGGGALPVPMAALFQDAAGPSGLRIPGMPFAHAFTWLPEGLFDDTPGAAGWLEERCRDLFGALGLTASAGTGKAHRVAPCNLLLARRWMLIVPRRAECFEGVSVNALGFAGSLFVRDAQQMDRVRQAGPMRVLQAVAR